MSRIGEYFSKQCGNPHGVVGKIMTWSMNRANNVMYKGIVNELTLGENMKLLDIGFGNGYLEKLIMRKSRCFIEGIDISEDMVEKASNHNRKYVDAGYMRFRLGDCCAMDYKDRSFDIVTTINTIYFWSDTMKGMNEIYRVLKPGGVFYNAVISKDKLDSIFYTSSGFKKFEVEEYMDLGTKAGFSSIDVKPLGNNYGLLIIYVKD